MNKVPAVTVKIKPERPVQSADVGESPHVRKKKIREMGRIKNVLLNKMRNNLR